MRKLPAVAGSPARRIRAKCAPLGPHQLIYNTVHGTATLAAYEDYLAYQVPVIWVPGPAYEISEILATLHGAMPQSPIESLIPEDWSFSK